MECTKQKHSASADDLDDKLGPPWVFQQSLHLALMDSSINHWAPKLVPAAEAVLAFERDGMMPIAVVGLGCCGCTDTTNVENLWNMILEAREAWSHVPKRSGTMMHSIILILLAMER